MGKFINVPLPLYSVTADMANPTISSTTTGAATGKLTDSGGGFSGVRNVGDIILESIIWQLATVTKVDSDTVLSIEGAATAALETSGAVFKIWTPSNAYSFKIATGTFLADVRVGDVVINTTKGYSAKVTKVETQSALQLDSIIFDDNGSDTAVVISQSGFGGRLVNLNNIVMSTPTAGGAGTTPIVLTYKTKTAANDILTITIAEAQANYSWQKAFEKLMLETLESEWTNVVGEMPLIAAPVVASKPAILYATGVALA